MALQNSTYYTGNESCVCVFFTQEGARTHHIHSHVVWLIRMWDFITARDMLVTNHVCACFYSFYIQRARWLIGCLRLVGSLKLQVSFVKEPYKTDLDSPKRPIILRRLLIVATPYHIHSHVAWLLYMRDSTPAHVRRDIFMWEMILWGGWD